MSELHGEYTDDMGITHAVAPGYEDGEIVILADDYTAWAISREWLFEKRQVSSNTRRKMLIVSDFFGDQIETGASGAKEVHLRGVSRAHLDLFVRAIDTRTPSTNMPLTEATTLIDLLLQHGCILPARRLLYGVVRELKAEELFDALVLASRLDDLKGACRIISQGWKWFAAPQKPETKSLCPNIKHSPWRVEHAEKIQNSWVWSLTLASTACHGQKGSWEHPEFWRIVVGEFVTNIVQ